VHELYADADVRDAVAARWGAGVAPGGVVDRAAVARRAFATSDDRAWLEELLWPRVRARMAAWRDEQGGDGPAPAALVVEVPLLFESGFDDAFDATIAVVADEKVRAARAGARGHAALAERGVRQLTQDEKAARADFVVRNDRDLRALEQELSRVLAKLTGP